MMPDREKVIKRLEECLSASCRGFRTCPYSDNEWDAVETALALLREQETEIVRCRNCRHYDTECCADGYGWCYELTGSRATDKRVMRLRIIRDALSDALTGKRSSAKDEIIVQQTAQLQAVQKRIMLLLEAGLITHNVARDLTETINTVGKEH